MVAASSEGRDRDRKRSAAELFEEVKRAGFCSEPIRLVGQVADRSTGEIRSSSLTVSCKDRREVLCPACSALYKTDAWILVSTGLLGGKGVPDTVASHPSCFVTLTAPSFGAVHRQDKRGACHRGGPGLCIHGSSLSCLHRHDDDDPALGDALCASCHDDRAAVLWNAAAGRLFARLVQEIPRQLAALHGVPRRALCSELLVSYSKVAEFQRRGVVHFHAILRADGRGDPFSKPPAWLHRDMLATAIRRAHRACWVRNADGAPVRFGAQVAIDVVEPGAQPKAASYLAKYATKTTNGSEDLARRFRSRAEIAQATLRAQHRRLALAAWDLGRTSSSTSIDLRRHAHCFGFSGQHLTKSRGYSATFSQLRAARAEHMRPNNDVTAIAGELDTSTVQGLD